MLAGSLLILATVLSAVGLLALSGWFITATAVTAGLWAAGLQVGFDIYTPGAGIRFFALARTVSRYAERLYNHDTVLRLLADLRGGVFAALARLEPATLMHLRAGTLLNRLTADIDALDNLYLRLLAPPLVALLAVGIITALLWYWLPAAGTVVLVAGTALLTLVTVTAAMQGLPVSRSLVAMTESLRVRLIEQVRGMAELSAYGTLEAHTDLIRRQDSQLLTGQRRLARMTAGWNAVSTLMVQLAAATVLGLGLHAHQTGGLSLAAAVLMPLAVIGLGEAFAGLPAAFARFGNTCAAAERLTATVNHPAHRAEHRPPVTLPPTPAIHVAGLSFSYPYAETPVFESLNLEIQSGEHVAITGDSGAGKSTLAELIMAMRAPTSGRISLAGVDITTIPSEQLYRVCAWLTQRTVLFEDTVAGNLRIAAPAAGATAMWQALEIAGLDGWLRQLPTGLDTWIGESGRRLSGGEARRLALARVVMRDPGIVLLDEPLSGLDPDTMTRVAERLQTWLTGRTAISLGHDTASLPAAAKHLQLSRGRLHHA